MTSPLEKKSDVVNSEVVSLARIGLLEPWVYMRQGTLSSLAGLYSSQGTGGSWRRVRGRRWEEKGRGTSRGKSMRGGGTGTRLQMNY